MFFERFGKKIASPYLFFPLLLFPWIIAFSLWALQWWQKELLFDQFETAFSQGEKAARTKQETRAFLERYQKKDPYFLQKVLESYPLLSEEKKETLFLSSHPAIRQKAFYTQTLQKLENNQLQFVEGKIETAPYIKETLERQINPILLNEKDLKRLLSWIENVSIGEYEPDTSSPQLIIEKASLKKKNAYLELELQILKREFF